MNKMAKQWELAVVELISALLNPAARGGFFRRGSALGRLGDRLPEEEDAGGGRITKAWRRLKFLMKLELQHRVFLSGKWIAQDPICFCAVGREVGRHPVVLSRKMPGKTQPTLSSQ